MDSLNDSVRLNMSNMSFGVSTTTSTEGLREAIRQYIFPKTMDWFFICIYAIVFLLGIIGNVLVCYAVWVNKTLRSVTNYFLVNLAFADFLVILICLPPSLIHDVTLSWLLGAAMCRIVTFLQFVSILVSVMTLTAIAIERYMAICRLLEFNISRQKTLITIFLIWVVAMACSSPKLFNMDTFPDNTVPPGVTIWLTTCQPINGDREIYYQIFIMTFFYLVPTIFIAFAYIKIALCLWSSVNVGKALSNDKDSAQLRMRKRSAKMLIVVVVLFFFCYLPLHIMNLLGYTKVINDDNINEMVYKYVSMGARFLCYFNSAINPVIYSLMSDKFKSVFKGLCCKCGCGYSETKKRDIYEDNSRLPLRSTNKKKTLAFSDGRTETFRLKYSSTHA